MNGTSTKVDKKLLKLGARKRAHVTPWSIVGMIFLTLVALLFLYPLVWMMDGSFRPMIEMFNLPPKFLQFVAAPSEKDKVDFTDKYKLSHNDAEPPKEAVDQFVKENTHLTFPSFKSYSFDNYIKAFTTWHIGTSLLMSFIVTVGGVLFTLLITSLCAYAFAYLKFPMKGFWFLFAMATMMLPGTTMIPAYYKLMNLLHLSNNLLCLILPAGISAYGVFLLRQFYIKLPYSLIESARIDGASHIKIWWNIILPLSMPALAALSIFQFQAIWNDFMFPMILLRDENLFTIPVTLKLMDSVNYNKPYDAIMATGFLFSLIPIIFFLLFQRFFIEGLSGGVKK